jgi:hypothetical protein
MVLGLVVAAAFAAEVWGAAGKTRRITVSSHGGQGNGDASSYSAASVSADGRFVAFEASASNLVPGDTNQVDDIFVRDLQTGTTRRVSLNSSGAQGNYSSSGPSISADGRFVAFESYATNLVAGDTNGGGDIFVRDLETNTTRRASVSSSGAQADDSQFILYSAPAISGDGRFVAFDSKASNLVAGDTNGNYDVFVRDLKTHTTRRVSVSSSGAQADPGSSPESNTVAISANGRFVAFDSRAPNLVAGDTNDNWDVFVRDLKNNTTRRVSLSSSGAQGNDYSGGNSCVSLSADGRFIAFQSDATNLVPGDTNRASDVFVRDRRNNTTRRVSVSSAGVQGIGGLYGSYFPSLSADGLFVAFTSSASNLVARDTNQANDVFVRDLQTDTTRRVSVSSSGAQANDYSTSPQLDANASLVVFTSNATNLVPGDTNYAVDTFVRGPVR